MKTMGLGVKISLGFVALIALAVGLGGLAVWNMTTVGQKVTVVAEERVPEINISSDLIVNLQRGVIDMRDFGFSGKPETFQKAQEKFKLVDSTLEKGREHVKKVSDGAALQAKLDKFESAYKEYRKLCQDVADYYNVYMTARTNARTVATNFENAIQKLYDVETEKLNKEIAAKVENDKVTERLKKVDLANNILSYAYNMRLSNRKMQADREPGAIKEVRDYYAKLTTDATSLRNITTSAEDQALINAAVDGAASYMKDSETMSKILATIQESGKARLEVVEKTIAAAGDIVDTGLAAATSSSGDSAKALSVSTTVMLIGLGISVVLGVILAFGITRSITGPVQRIIASLTGGSEQTASASSQVASSSQNLAQGASEQAASLEETTSALQEMAAMTQKNAETAQQASTFAGETKKAAEEGHLAMTRMSEAITQIEKSAGETAKIIKVIDEIAFQTNLLALNAAVEAARAGDAGKGFAVVAEEVRNLAMRSAEAAKNTSSLIEESVANARNGVTIVADVAKSLEGINTASTKVHSLVNEIAAASNEQAQGISQINSAMSNMDHVTQSNAAAAEESASAAEELSSQAIELNTVVSRLQTIVTGHAADMTQAAARHANRHSSHATTATIAPPSHLEERPIKSAKPAKSSNPELSTRSAKGEAVIPLDGDAPTPGGSDFSDFGSAK